MVQETSAAHYKKMYDRVSTLARIGVWECDLATGELAWTDMVYDIFGVDRGLAIDREMTLQLYEPKSRLEMERLRSEAIANGTGFRLDIQIKPKANGARWVRLTAVVEQKAGKSVRIFGTKQDVTSEIETRDKLHSLQTELIHLSRGSAMGAMASTLAHELNQPLAAVSSYLSAALRIAPRETAGSELDECIEGALEAAHRAGDIIRSVRAMSAKGDGKKRVVELGPVLEEATALATAGIEHLTVSWDVPSGLTVYADSVQIQQVLINLIRNACEAVAGSACHIDIKAWSTGSYVQVCVSDDGPGIPADVMTQIFEAFISTKAKGLGVGLSISRTIVEAHGGQMTATNLPGRGASMCFTLPEGTGELAAS
ncbi:sensor histidine kinase [Tsuneonella sp. HG222]